MRRATRYPKNAGSRGLAFYAALIGPAPQNEPPEVQCSDCRHARPLDPCLWARVGADSLRGFVHFAYDPPWEARSEVFRRHCDKFEAREIPAK